MEKDKEVFMKVMAIQIKSDQESAKDFEAAFQAALSLIERRLDTTGEGSSQ